LSVGGDGVAWVLDGSSNAWRQAASGCKFGNPASPPPEGATFASLTAGLTGEAWAVDSEAAIWQFKRGAWARFPTPLPTGIVVQVSAGATGTL
jgi:hypothetical protein